MARIKASSDLAAYIQSLESLEGKTRSVMGKAVYAGAKVVTDEVRKAIQGVRVRGNKQAPPGQPISGLTSVQRTGLLKGMGIASMRNDAGYLNVKVGFEGYNRTFTKKFPKGVPNVLVARALEKGATWHVKEPVISKATRSSRTKAVAEMEKELERQIRVAKGD